MKKDVMEVCRDIHNYWRDLLLQVDSPEVDIDLKQSIYDCDKEILSIAVKSSEPNELYQALESDDEELKLYYMQRIWYRYMDLKAGRTKYDGTLVVFTNDSSIHELNITTTSVKYLHQENVNYLFQIPDKMQNLPYANALDIAAALSTFQRWRALC